jgi:zinc-ribbon domain
MVCPKCRANVANDSNFCPRCGTPFKHRSGFVANLWRDNKPGFLILSLLLVAMLGSIGYYLYSRTGRFVVTVERISRDEALDIYTKATLKVYCREFRRECTERGENQIEKDIRLLLPGILLPPKNPDAKITYRNRTSTPISIKRFLYRNGSETWKSETPQTYFAPKLNTLRLAIQMANDNVPFKTKVDLASTLALTENHGTMTILPGEDKSWRVGYGDQSEFKIEYTQNGKSYETPVLRAG